jgi:hypothetical protein
VLKIQRKRLPPALACKLLRTLRGIVADSVLFGIVIYSIGCIVPTPLDQSQPPKNYPPVFQSATPPFGPLHQAQTDVFNISLIVDDPDDQDSTSQDDIHVRLFFKNGEQFITAYGDQKMVPSSTTDPTPTLRYASFDAIAPCFGRTGVQYLYAIVSDRGFDAMNPSQPLGLSDSNHWELTCM